MARVLAVLALCTAGDALLTVTEVQFERKANGTSARVASGLRGAGKPLVGDPKVHESWDYLPHKDPKVVEKYTKAESVQSTLFVMACKAKHKNDVDGMARDKAKQEGFNEQEFADYVKKLQDANLAQMKERCGKINSKYAKACSEDCTARWAKGGTFSLVNEKAKCIARCNQKHTEWEEQCDVKVDELKDVFVQEQGNMANTKQCQQLHCREFPAVLMMKDDEAKDSVKEGCEGLCTDDAIKSRCLKKWGLEVDTKSAQWQEDCAKETEDGTLKPCVDEGTGKADEEMTKCKDDGKTACEDEATTCISDAKAGGEDTMVGAHADSICGVRKDACITQNEGKCDKAHTKALDKMSKKCKKEHKEKSKECFDGKLKDGEESFQGTCFDETKPTCKEDCVADCKIEDMRTCQDDMLKRSFGITAEYCTKLWQWMFDSEQYEAQTMDPIPKAEGGGRFKTVKRAKR